MSTLELDSEDVLPFEQRSHWRREALIRLSERDDPMAKAVLEEIDRLLFERDNEQ